MSPSNEAFPDPKLDVGFKLPSRLIRRITSILFIISVIGAAATLRQIPLAPDLYNFVNHNVRPAKPEGTVQFLFIFPAFLGAAAFFTFRNRNQRPTSYKSTWERLGAALFLIAWLSVFFVGSVLRDVAAYNYYHP